MESQYKTNILEIKGNWEQVKRACLTTVGKEMTKSHPSSRWKRELLMAEHSPIRKITVCWSWETIPYAISTHFARHHVGCTPWIKTSRADRTKVERSSRPQTELISMEMEANLQSIINISRVRLCKKADPETTKYWNSFLNELKNIDEDVYFVCVPQCIRYAGCPEIKSCKYFLDFKDAFIKDNMIERYETYYSIIDGKTK